MGQRRAKQDASAMALFNMARQYHNVANELLLIATTKRWKPWDPLYLLYFHTIELALKAFLRTHNKCYPLKVEVHQPRARALAGWQSSPPNKYSRSHGTR
jgi:hypothetical protein